MPDIIGSKNDIGGGGVAIYELCGPISVPGILDHGELQRRRCLLPDDEGAKQGRDKSYCKTV